MTSAPTPEALRTALEPLASWLAARDGYGFFSELSPDEQQAYVCGAGTCLEQSGLAAFVVAALAERDEALKAMEMCATSGAFHAKHAENAEAREADTRAECDALKGEVERLRAALAKIAEASPEPDDKQWYDPTWNEPETYRFRNQEGAVREGWVKYTSDLDHFGFQRGTHAAAVTARAALAQEARDDASPDSQPEARA